jgi:hypothetical protein
MISVADLIKDKQISGNYFGYEIPPIKLRDLLSLKPPNLPTVSNYLNRCVLVVI